MNIAIASIFRDSQRWRDKQICQVDKYMAAYLPYHCDIYCLEGDSEDDTLAVLTEYEKREHPRIKLFKFDVKTQFLGSIEDATRISGIALAQETLRQQIPYDRYDYVLWIESDIIVPSNFISNLMAHLETSGADIIAPLVWIQQNGEPMFYDSWGYICNGQRFPNHKKEKFLRRRKQLYHNMDSIGTCALMRSYVLSNTTFGTNGFRSFCEQAKENKYKIVCTTSPEVYIQHPSTECIENRWI